MNFICSIYKLKHAFHFLSKGNNKRIFFITFSEIIIAIKMVNDSADINKSSNGSRYKAITNFENKKKNKIELEIQYYFLKLFLVFHVY